MDNISDIGGPCNNNNKKKVLVNFKKNNKKEKIDQNKLFRFHPLF